MKALDWMDQAACRNTQVDMTRRGNTLQALQVCKGCPVLGPCHDYAFSDLGRGIPGVLAGLTVHDRGQVECSQCEDVDWKKNTRNGLCWRCYQESRRTA